MNFCDMLLVLCPLIRELSDHLLHCIISGERTFGVLTKIDLMDKGTDAVEVSSPLYFVTN